jgi:hypothetical protein
MRYILTSLLLAFSLLSGAKAMAIEKPNYTVVMSEDKFEVREYPPMMLAEVKVTGNRDQAANRGFRKLAAFIFGDNTPNSKIAMTAPVMQKPESQKIAMTAPVMQTPNADGKWTVNFMMPSEYSMETLPKPTDSDIRIYMSEPYRTVSIRFSGRGKMKNLNKHQAKLDEFVAAQGLKIVGGPEYAFYNAPFVPPFLRRNEVHYRLAASN